MNDAIRKAETLIEALSYIRQFRNRLIVIKLGGSAMEEPAALKATLQDVIFMSTVGLRPIVVHGGGKPIDRAMAESGLKPRKVLGRRYTDDETLAIVVRVLLKEINADNEGQIRQMGGRAGIGPPIPVRVKHRPPNRGRTRQLEELTGRHVEGPHPGHQPWQTLLSLRIANRSSCLHLQPPCPALTGAIDPSIRQSAPCLAVLPAYLMQVAPVSPGE